MPDRELFYERSKLPSALAERLASTVSRIGTTRAEAISSSGDEATFVESARAEPITLRIAEAKLDWRERTMRPGRPDSGGIAATLTIPFTGNGMLLDYPPSHQPSEMPKGVAVSDYKGNHHVRFEYESSAIDADAVRAWREDQESRLTQWIEAANNDAATHNERVAPAVTSAVEARKATLAKLAEFGEAIRKP